MRLRGLPAAWLLLTTGLLAAASSAQPQDATTLPSLLPPSGRDLSVIPLPRLDDVEPLVAEQVRELQRAVAVAVDANSATKDLAEAYGSLGRVYHAYEFFEAAEASYRNASRLARDDFRWPHLLAYLYQQTGRPQEAADTYFAALRVQPNDRPATLHLADVYLQLNRLREAREQFESVATTFPAAASNGLGEVSLRERRFEAAIAHFRDALDRVPDATSIHYSLAMAYRGLGRLDEARSHLQRRGRGGIRAVDPIIDELQSLVRGERALVIQGRRAYEAGQFKDAADAFSKAVSAAPSSAASRVNLGLAQSQLGDATGATDQFEAALRLDSDNVIAHASLGILLARQGRDREAVDHLRAAFAREPHDVNVREEFVGALIRLGREDDAMEILTRARSIDPDDEGPLVSMAILLSHRERYREAVTLLEDGNRQFPDRAATATTLARLLASSPDLSLRDGQRALDLAMAVYASSQTPVYGETVAIALAELGRCREALQWLRRAVAEAERIKEGAEMLRLRGEMPKYEGVLCKAPGK